MNESKDQQIISRWHGGQSMRGIARDLGISRHRVARTIRRWQRAREEGPRHPDLPHTRGPRKSKLDAFGEALAQFLERYPNITVTRMLEELRQLG